MGKKTKMGTIKDVDPNDVIDLARTIGKIVVDLMKKDKSKEGNKGK